MQSTASILSSSDNPAQPTFHLFSHLPIELRLLIWSKAVGNLAHDRIVVLRDPYVDDLSESDEEFSRPGIHSRLFDPIPKTAIYDGTALLHVNTEARRLLLSLLKDGELREQHNIEHVHTKDIGKDLPTAKKVVDGPRPGYQFVDPTKARVLQFVKSTGLYTRLTYPHAHLLDSVLHHYNSKEHYAEAAQYPDYLQLGAPYPRLSPPLWFNVDEDFLLIPCSRDARAHYPSRPRWNECSTLQAQKVKKLVIEISRADWRLLTRAYHSMFPSWVWSKSLASGEVDWRALDKIEEVAVSTREGCELCWFTRDAVNGPLKPGEWSFRLDTSDNQFKERFGKRWANMTWHIVVGRSEVEGADGEPTQKNICEMLRDWRPHSRDWWNSKLQITAKVPDGVLGQSWIQYSREQYDNSPSSVTLTPVEGALEGTYLGPSFGADLD